MWTSAGEGWEQREWPGPEAEQASVYRAEGKPTSCHVPSRWELGKVRGQGELAQVTWGLEGQLEGSGFDCQWRGSIGGLSQEDDLI